MALRLQLARKKAGITEQKLAKAVGMSRSALTALSGGRSHSTEFIPALARELAVDEAWLLCGLGVMPSWMRETWRRSVALMFRVVVRAGEGPPSNGSSADEWLNAHAGHLSPAEKRECREAFLDLQAAELRQRLFARTVSAETRTADYIPLSGWDLRILLDALSAYASRAKNAEDVYNVIESVLARHYPNREDSVPVELLELTGRTKWTYTDHLFK